MKLRAGKQAIENNLTKVQTEEEALEQLIEQYTKDMSISQEQQLVKSQWAKYETYLDKKLRDTAWGSDFFKSMYTRLESGISLTPNMTAAIDRCIARDEEYEAKKNLPKEDKPQQKITCKMREWWVKQHNLGSRVISGTVLAESAKAYHVKGHADMVEGTYCMRCGRKLTEPASMAIGFGAECCEKLGIPYPVDILEASEKERRKLRKQLLKVLHNQEFEAWIPKSQIQELISIEEIKPKKKK